MSHNYLFTSLCKNALTVTSFSILAVVSVPSQVFSLTTEILDIQGKTVNTEQRKNDSLTNLLSGEKSNFLIAKKDDHKQKNRKDHDDDDDYKNNRRRGNDDNNRNSGYGREENYRSSKYYRSQDWNCLFKIGRLVNSNQKALVIQLDILEKPVTRYANVIYTIYARQNNRWVKFYSTSGDKLIGKKAGKYFLNPEVIEFNQLRQGNLDLSRSDLRVVTEINYDSKSSRNEKIVFEDVWNYNSITEINSISQITNVNTNTNTTAGNYNRNSRRGDDDNRGDYQNNNRQENQREEKRYSSKAFRVKDWNGLFKIGRLVNSNQKALVVQLDILEKPVTRYANVVYTVYARKDNRWVPFYNTRGARLIDKKAGKYFLTPEVIEFSQLRQGNLDLSRSDLRFVTEIIYDSSTSRNEKLVFENVWNYSSITEINSISQLSVVNY